MELTAREVQEKKFRDAWRGYSQRDVDEFLDRVAEALDAAARENEDLQRRVSELDQAMAASRDTEEMLKKTLITAQRAAEEAIANAKAHAEELISEADAHVERANTEARELLQQADAEARRKNDEWERQSAARRRDLDERIEKLRLLEGDIRLRLTMFLEQQLKAVEALTQGDPSRQPAPQARPAAQRPQAAGPQNGPDEEVAVVGHPADDGAPATVDVTEEEVAPSRRMRDLFNRQQG